MDDGEIKLKDVFVDFIGKIFTLLVENGADIYHKTNYKVFEGGRDVEK